MERSAPLGKVIRFGVFEMDLRAGELRKQGLKVRLQDQPFQILSILLERPGEVGTREELCQRLWPDGTFVEFDHSVSTAISKLRDALGDTAENPRFVETLARRGYRFIAPADLNRANDSPQVTIVREKIRWRFSRRGLVWVAGILLLLAIVAVAVWFIRSPSTEPASFLSSVPLTSYPGWESSPSFSPDGNQVAFCWNGEKQDNFDIYVKLVGAGRQLRLSTNPAKDTSPAWSPDGRFIAFLRELPGRKTAVLLVPALGGPEQKVAETTALLFSTSGLAWSPDSKWLVVADKSSALEPRPLFLLSIESGEKRRLTMPTDQSTGDIFGAFSPDGRTLAFVRTIGSIQSASSIYLLAVSSDFAPMGQPKRLTFDNWTVGGLA